MQGFIPTGIATADICTLILDLTKKFGQSQWSMKCRSSAPCHSKWFLSVSRAIAMHILPPITAAEKCTLFLDSK